MNETPCEHSVRTLGRWLIATVVMLLLVAGVFMVRDASAAEIVIPESSAIYRLQLERSAGRYFGLNAPVARLAAQLHQESGWRPRAASKYANGLAQFTPATAKWMPEICPELGKPDVWDTTWSLGAVACYDAWLYSRVEPILEDRPTPECSRWNFTLRAYNGGEKWLQRERMATANAGHDPDDWRAVEKHRVRAGWAHKENIGYPRRILWRLEQAYLAAGWPGQRVCT